MSKTTDTTLPTEAKKPNGLPLMTLQHRDKLADMIGEAEAAYWNEQQRIADKGYPSRREQVEDLVRLGNLASYVQLLISAQAAVEAVKREGS